MIRSTQFVPLLYYGTWASYAFPSNLWGPIQGWYCDIPQFFEGGLRLFEGDNVCASINVMPVHQLR